jgi:hypothetical protein
MQNAKGNSRKFTPVSHDAQLRRQNQTVSEQLNTNAWLKIKSPANFFLAIQCLSCCEKVTWPWKHEKFGNRASLW